MTPLVLRLDSQGQDVKDLQAALQAHGFNPGLIDGRFGGGTQAAVISFQTSEGLLADGVAGPRTRTALGLTDDPALPDVRNDVTVEIVSRMFPATPLSNIKKHLPVVLDALGRHALSDHTMTLMALATIRAETESFQPLSEGRSRFNTSPNGHDFDLYDKRRDLGNLGPSDGAAFRGRGFVQLTGRANYARYGQRLTPAVDLQAHPEQANEPSAASDLLCLFIGDRQLQIKDALMHNNLQAARRLVNGGLHGLDRFTDAWRTGQRLLPDA
jgi:putative chitinase